jgi:integral membrane protein
MIINSKLKKNLIRIGHYEGISYLLLLFIAMPLKYLFSKPEAVKIVGSLHGVLFVGFMIILAWAFKKLPLTFKQAATCFLLSLIPFGTFYLNRVVK